MDFAVEVISKFQVVQYTDTEVKDNAPLLSALSAAVNSVCRLVDRDSINVDEVKAFQVRIAEAPERFGRFVVIGFETQEGRRFMSPGVLVDTYHDTREDPLHRVLDSRYRG